MDKNKLKTHEDVLNIYSLLFASYRTKYELQVRNGKFHGPYTTVTQMIKKEEFKPFKEAAKDIFDRPSYRDKKQLFSPTMYPATFGTFASEYITYLIDPKKYIKNAQMEAALNGSDILNKLLNKEVFDYETFACITYSIEDYRAGAFSDKPRKILEQMSKGTYKNEEFENDYKLFDGIIKNQVDKYIKDKNVVNNPVVGSKISGLKGDGDLIIDKSLVEIKCSKVSTFKIDYVVQLLTYKFLNNLLPEEHQYEIGDSFIYWNPFYDIFTTISFDDLTDLERIFNECRIKVIRPFEDEYHNKRIETAFETMIVKLKKHKLSKKLKQDEINKYANNIDLMFTNINRDTYNGGKK